MMLPICHVSDHNLVGHFICSGNPEEAMSIIAGALAEMGEPLPANYETVTDRQLFREYALLLAKV